MPRAALIPVAIALFALPAAAQELNPTVILAEVTSAVCEPIADVNSGSLIKKKLEVEAGINLKGVLKKLADAGLSGAASIDSTKYVNGLASDALAGEIASHRDCNLRIYDDFREPIKTWIANKDTNGAINSTGNCNNNTSGSGNTSTTNCTISN